MNMDLYTIESDAPHLKAFQKIEVNHKCFLIVLKERKVVGTFTDGDVRRAFLKGVKISDPIEKTYNRQFEYISVNDDLTAAIERFQRKNIKFLPVIGEEGELKNIITKESMEWVLLQSRLTTLDQDFISMDELNMQEIYLRPWGFYKTTVINDFFQSKIINVDPMASISLQRHMRREEYWIIIHGTGKVQIGASVKTVTAGTTLFIPKECLHRITNISDSDCLIITEVQLGDYFGEDDIIRYEDEYGRM